MNHQQEIITLLKKRIQILTENVPLQTKLDEDSQALWKDIEGICLNYQMIKLGELSKILANLDLKCAEETISGIYASVDHLRARLANCYNRSQFFDTVLQAAEEILKEFENEPTE
jgi:hypothetical protein